MIFFYRLMNKTASIKDAITSTVIFANELAFWYPERCSDTEALIARCASINEVKKLRFRRYTS